MKKSKKLLSVLLAAVMSMSSLSAATVAFAKEAPEEPAKETIRQDPTKRLISVYEQLIGNDKLTDKQLQFKSELENLISDFSDAGRAFIMSLGADEATLAVQEKITEMLAIQANLGAAKPVVPSDPNDKNYEKKKAELERYENKLKLYNEIVPLYKALNESQKDSMDIKTALQFLGEVQKKEAFDIKTASGNTLSPIEANEKAIESFESLLGKHSVRDEAVAIGKVAWEPVGYKMQGKVEVPVILAPSINFKDYSKAPAALDNLIKTYQGASDLGRAYFDGISSANHGFGVSLIGGGLTNLVKMVVKKQMDLGEETFDKIKPTTPQKPNDKDTTKYPGGKQDPNYIKDFEIYLAGQKKVIDYDVEKKNWEANLNEAALLSITAKIPSMKAFADTAIQLRKGFEIFNKTNEGEEAAKAIDMFDALPAYAQAVLNAYSVHGYSYAYLNSSKTMWLKKDLAVNKLYAECVKAKDIFLVNNFVDYIDSVNLSKVTNETVAEAIEEYNKVPSDLRINIPAETMAKYEKILNLYIPVAPRTPSAYDFAKEIKDYNSNKAYVALPKSEYATVEGVNAVMAELDSILTSIIVGDKAESLPELLETGVYTNGAMATVFNIFIEINKMDIQAPPLGNIAPIIANELTPKKLADMLPEEEFAKAKAKLLATVAADGTSSVDDYAKIHWDNGDWGFQDGDREGFENALAAALRPVMNLLHNGLLMIKQVLGLPNYLEKNGDYAYGAYDELVPALEAMGFNVPTSYDYTVNFNEQDKISKEKGLSALSAPLIHAIFDFVEELAAAPVETLVKYLPGIAHTIDTGLLDSSVKNCLGTSSLLGGLTGSLDLSGDGINAMLTASPISIPVDEETTIEIALMPIDWNTLAGCGTAYKAGSVRSTNLYRVGIEADTVKTFATLYYYLFDVVFDDGNFASIKDGLRKSNPVLSFAIVPVLNVYKSLGKVDSLGLVLDLLAGGIGALLPDIPGITDPDPEEPTNPENPTNPDGDNDKTDNVDDPTIPNTAGEKAGLALASLAVLGGLGAGVCVYKRKKNEE